MQEQQRALVLALLGYAAQKDIAVGPLCRLSGIEPDRLRQPNAPALTAKQVDDLWLNATHLSHDPLFGLHFGESMQLTALGVVGSLLQHCRTIGDALTHAAAFTELVTDLVAMTIDRDETTFTIRFLPQTARQREAPSVFRQQMDLFMAFTLHEADGLTLQRLAPLAVSYPVQEPERAELERVFRCRTLHESDGYALTFAGRYWDEPILTVNYELQSLFLQQVTRQNQALTDRKSMSDRIGTFLLANAYLGIPSLKDLAANLNVSPRNLQRKLRNEGVTYQQLADSVRKSLAQHYLESGKYPLKEIAYILGYNELSAFTRAFKRWTGAPPLHYQQQRARE